MWDIFERRQIQKSIRMIPREVIVRYEAWKRIVEIKGPEGLREIKGFHDEGLKGEWQGYRSSRLNLKWRVIYLVKREACEVYVIEVNPHKY